MKLKIIIFCALLALIMPVNANINITVDADCNLPSLTYQYTTIKKYAEASTRAEREFKVDSVFFINHKAVIPIPSQLDSYIFDIDLDSYNLTLYVLPEDNIDITIQSLNPLSFHMSGTELAKEMSNIYENEILFIEEIKGLYDSGLASTDEIDKLTSQYTDMLKEYINANPSAPSMPVALLSLIEEDYVTTYDQFLPYLQNSILSPLTKTKYNKEKKKLEMEQRQQDLQSGKMEAPNFTLKALDGNDVSLNEFRGEWVILDFWGSWCPWCIKGFPELKDAYIKYSGKLEIIGVDCRESEENWKAGVEKYELPWINVYNPQDSKVLEEYGVQGFPTKVIIAPDGTIANITVGHDPVFFDVLTKLMEN